MALYYDVRVDISADKVIDTGYHFTQGDSQQIYLRVAVMNGTSKFNGSDASSVTINFKKPDFTFVEGIPELVGDVYQYQFIGNELQAAGPVLCDIKFAYESGRVSSGMFKFIVDDDTSSDTAIKSSGYIGTLQQAKEEAEELVYKLQTDYEDSKGIVDNAKKYAELSESYAHGNTEERPEEDTDNAKYYSEQAESYKNQAYQYTQDFKYTHVMYSANSDGSNMTSTPTDSTVYMGVYTGTSKTAPSTPSSYTWSKIRGNDGYAYFADFDVVNAELIMSYTTDPGTINFSINNNGELEVSK